MKTDWFPSKRSEMLAIALQWKTVLANGNKWQAWDFTNDEVTKLTQLYERALAAYNNNLSAARGPVTAAAAVEAFRALEAHMRDIKRRRIYCPPLTDADLVSLWLKVKDTVRTPIPAPTIRPVAVVKLKSAGAFYICMGPESDISGSEKAYHGYKIVYDMFAYNEEAPTSIEQLKRSRFVRRRRELFVFQPSDSGKKAYFGIRYENSKGVEGPWCQMFSVFIP